MNFSLNSTFQRKNAITFLRNSFELTFCMRYIIYLLFNYSCSLPYDSKCRKKNENNAMIHLLLVYLDQKQKKNKMKKTPPSISIILFMYTLHTDKNAIFVIKFCIIIYISANADKIVYVCNDDNGSLFIPVPLKFPKQ